MESRAPDGAETDASPAVAAEIQALEERLLDPRARRDGAQLAALLAPDFLEFGSSGRVLDRAACVAELARETERRFEVSGFHARQFAPGVVLATYRVAGIGPTPARSSSLRASLWVRRGSRWQLVFHQGTPTASKPDRASR